MQRKILLSIAIIFSLLFSLPSSAQTSLDTIGDSITSIVTPQNPAPESNVKIRLDSTLVSLSNSYITWYVNGKVVLKGQDERTLTTKIGKSGETTSINVSVDSKEYGLITKEFNFQPGGVDIFFEAETFVPPFYKGKALPSAQSTVKAIAIPNFKTKSGATILTNDLVFTWKKDGEVDGTNSGRGKNTYRFNVGPLPTNSPNIEVSVFSPDFGVTGYANLTVSHQKPEILLYEDNAILGIELQRAVGDTLNMTKPEITLVSYPYFFSAKTKDSKNLKFDWTINSTTITPKSSSNAKLTIRRPETSGNSFLSLNIEHLAQIFQSASANINVIYGK